MSDVNNNQILQAISELAEEVKSVSQELTNVESRLNEKIDKVDARLSEKIDKNGDRINRIDNKLSILSDELLETKAEVKILKNAE